MKYINPKSKSGIVNKLADFILKHIDEKHKTVIEVIYLGNFFIIKGITESDKILNLHEIRNSFTEKYSYLLSLNGIDNINFIDVFKYEQKINSNTFDFKFYNSDNLNFHQKVVDYIKKTNLDFNVESIDFDIEIEKNQSSISEITDDEIINLNEMSIKSEFPYGYSLGAGRLELFYSEYVVNQIFNLIKTDKLIFRFSNKKNVSGDLNIKIFSNSCFSQENIKSLVLDIFDFNLLKFKNEYLLDFEVEHEIDNQLTPRKWYIKDRSNDLIIF